MINGRTKCNLHNCVGNKDGSCRILNSTDFEGKVCPFFKTVEQNEQEKKSKLSRIREKILSRKEKKKDDPKQSGKGDNKEA